MADADKRPFNCELGVWMYDWIGWTATALFASSYVSKQPATMRRIQGLAALFWAVYGAMIHSLPVLVANLIVAAMAIGSSFTRLLPAPSRDSR